MIYLVLKCFRLGIHLLLHAVSRDGDFEIDEQTDFNFAEAETNLSRELRLNQLCIDAD
jgi:hypothetical protein